MASPVTSTVVIACPDCGTRYQLPPDAIGPKGRKVACAHCGGTWHAKAGNVGESDADRLFDEEAEAALDAAFAAAERVLAAPQGPADVSAAAEPDPGEGPDRSIAEIRAAIAPRSRPNKGAESADDKKRQKDFRKRQAATVSRLPLARVRRSLRIAGVSALTLLIVGGTVFRTEIVRQFPDLAGAYEAVGLGVNLVGLEFRDVTTLVTLRNGAKVMQVDARIHNVAGRYVVVPPVVVTLLDDAGTPLYEWSATPEAHDLEGGEVVDFKTQRNAPPEGAARVRLAFSDGKARPRGAVTAAFERK